VAYNEDGTMTVGMGGTRITILNQGNQGYGGQQQGGMVNYFGKPPQQGQGQGGQGLGLGQDPMDRDPFNLPWKRKGRRRVLTAILFITWSRNINIESLITL
jgi:hypothetical protein